MKKTFFIILFFIYFTHFSFSQANESSVTGEGELYDEFRIADKQLNVVYNKLKNKLDITDKTALINAQKAYLKFRELNCKFTSKEDSESGVIANKMKIDCLTQSTLERTKELKDLIEYF